MQKDRKKNVQARQSSDGTFELFVGAGGLEEISEDEVSYAEIIHTEPEKKEKKSISKVTLFSIGAVVLLGVALSLFLFSGGRKKKPRSSEFAEVQGFRAYTGVSPTKKKSVLKRKSSLRKSPPIALPDEDTNASDHDEENEDSVAWKLTPTEEEARLAEQEARIQPNRNPTPESVDIVFLDENDDEIDKDTAFTETAQKGNSTLPRLGKIPRNLKIPSLKNLNPKMIDGTFPGLKPKVDFKMLAKEVDAFDSLPNKESEEE